MNRLIRVMIFAPWIAGVAMISYGTRADDAPGYPCPGKDPCKVITITQNESDSLTNALFPAALWANRTMTDLVEMWRNKIQQAPQGKVQSETKPEPKVEAKPETPTTEK